MTAYARAMRVERLACEMLRDAGWFVINGKGSKGSADIVALRAGHRPRLIQVKSGPTAMGGFGPADRRRLLDDALLAGGDPWLLWKPPREPFVWIPDHEWPDTLRAA